MTDLSLPKIPNHSEQDLISIYNESDIDKYAFESARGLLLAATKIISIEESSQEYEQKRAERAFPVIMGHIAKCLRLGSSLLNLACKENHGEASDYIAVQIIRSAIQGVWLSAENVRLQSYIVNSLLQQKAIASKISNLPGDQKKKALKGIESIFESLQYSMADIKGNHQPQPFTEEMANDIGANDRLFFLMQIHKSSFKSSFDDLFNGYLKKVGEYWTVGEGRSTKTRYLIGACIAVIPLINAYVEKFLTLGTLKNEFTEYLNKYEKSLNKIFDFEMQSHISKVPSASGNSEQQKATPLNKHRRFRKKLTPPLMEMDFTFDSWMNHRLPEMLWAVLIHEKLGRTRALGVFREIIELHNKKSELSGDITISGISDLRNEQKETFFSVLKSDKECQLAIAPLALFPGLPSKESWQAVFIDDNSDDLWNRLAKSIVKCLDHQGQESTDCRWLKLACVVIRGKMHLPTKEHYREIFEYPDFGDQRKVRPFIRASEPMTNLGSTPSQQWSNHFWKICLLETACMSPEKVIPQYQPTSSQISKQYLHKLTDTLHDGYLSLLESSSIHPKQDAIFGMATYVCDIALDAIGISETSISGLFCLRSIAEIVINLKYLLSKDDVTLWQKFRDYGIGQAKLIKLRYEESNDVPNYLPLERITRIANEDRWEEFSDIDLGDWSGDTLRKRAISGNAKEIYDRYYEWPSGFLHGQWHAIRSAAFETCHNPLHRLHRMPKLWKFLPSIKSDIQYLVEILVETVQQEYNGLNLQRIDD